jgi:hypothetical protein
MYIDLRKGIYMGLISSAAFFEMCECGSHGRIVLADGSRRKELCSLLEVREDLERCKQQKLLTPEELPELERQIGRSGLPKDERNVSFLHRLCVDLANINIETKEAREKEPSVPKGVYVGKHGTA